MTRPDGVEEWAWEEAGRVVGAPEVYIGRLSHLIVLERVAVALQQARADGREDILRILTEMVETTESQPYYAVLSEAISAIRSKARKGE